MRQARDDGNAALLLERGEYLQRAQAAARYEQRICLRRLFEDVSAEFLKVGLCDLTRVAYRFQPELLALAKYPNVAVKATGQPGYAEDAYPFRSFHEHLHRVFDAFGPQRMFWGTDITRMPCSWRQCVTVFTEELPWLKGRDLELVMGEALCNWVGWTLPG